MAKTRFTISVEPSFKKQVEKIAHLYAAQGIDITDEKKGGISYSAVLRELVEEKVREIEKGQKK